MDVLLQTILCLKRFSIEISMKQSNLALPHCALHVHTLPRRHTELEINLDLGLKISKIPLFFPKFCRDIFLSVMRFRSYRELMNMSTHESRVLKK
jgi:hypothetical protein